MTITTTYLAVIDSMLSVIAI